MQRDTSIFLLGEDIGRGYGGAFRVTEGLAEEFGDYRVRNTPISELAIIGAAVGAAMTGMRPVAEIQYSDFVTLAMDQVVNQAAKLRYISGGQVRLPMVIRLPTGATSSRGAQHSQSLEAWFIHIPGLKVCVPSTPYDAKGLLKTALRGEDPVLYFEHKLIYGKAAAFKYGVKPIVGLVPKEDYEIPFGRADIKREGEDVTIVATLTMVHKSLSAAEELDKQKISAEVIDPRTLVPLDKKAILDSVKKTGRIVVVTEGYKTGGVGAEIAAVVAEEGLYHLDAPVKRVSCLDVPIPFSPVLEKQCIPNEDNIVKAVREIT